MEWKPEALPDWRLREEASLRAEVEPLEANRIRCCSRPPGGPSNPSRDRWIADDSGGRKSRKNRNVGNCTATAAAERSAERLWRRKRPELSPPAPPPVSCSRNSSALRNSASMTSPPQAASMTSPIRPPPADSSSPDNLHNRRILHNCSNFANYANYANYANQPRGVD